LQKTAFLTPSKKRDLLKATTWFRKLGTVVGRRLRANRQTRTGKKKSAPTKSENVTLNIVAPSRPATIFKRHTALVLADRNPYTAEKRNRTALAWGWSD